MKLAPSGIATLSLLLAGCGTHPASVPIEGKRILVIPFSEGARPPFESRLGRELAVGISAVILDERLENAAILDFRDVEGLAKGTDVDWRAVGVAAKADYLLIGNIREYRLREPKDLTTRRGTLAVEYRVLDVATGADVLLVPMRTFHYPPDTSRHEESFNYGVDIFTDPGKIAQGLLLEASLGIAGEFLEHGHAE